MRKFLLSIVLILLVACQPNHKPEVNSVYYEIYVGSFYDSDGDGKGDLNGVLEKLDYIQNDLGATGIWLMPIHPSPTYHKYDVVDYKDIDEDYGTLEDFDKLVSEMNRREMDLILDLVVNHTSSKHPWFLKAKEAHLNGKCDEVVECDFYNFSNERLPGYHKINNDLYYEGVFWGEMPDLNLDNPQVRENLLDISKFWLDKGVKGFRLDATTHFYAEDKSLNISFLDWFNKEIKNIKSDAYLVGEAWTGTSIIKDMYASGIDSFFNFSFSQQSGTINQAVNTSDGMRLAQQVERYQSDILKKNPNAIDAIFLTNHDNNRSAGYLLDLEKRKMSASLYLLMPGNVFIYYGEEVGLKGSGIDENKRLPMPWSKRGTGVTNPPENADYVQGNYEYVEDALKDKNSLLNHYRQILRIRHQYPEISRGNVIAYDLGHKALYALEHDGNIMVIHNLSQDEIEFDLNHDKMVLVTGKAKSKENKITLGGLSSIIIEK